MSRLKGFLSKDVITVPWSPEPLRRKREIIASSNKRWHGAKPIRAEARRRRTRASVRDDRILVLHDMGEGHPEQPDRLRVIDRAKESEVFQIPARDVAPRAEISAIARVPLDYIEAIRSATPTQGAHGDRRRDLGFAWLVRGRTPPRHPGTFDRAESNARSPAAGEWRRKNLRPALDRNGSFAQIAVTRPRQRIDGRERAQRFFAIRSPRA